MGTTPYRHTDLLSFSSVKCALGGAIVCNLAHGRVCSWEADTALGLVLAQCACVKLVHANECNVSQSNRGAHTSCKLGLAADNGTMPKKTSGRRTVAESARAHELGFRVI